MSHGRTECKKCGTVLVSCRCPGPHPTEYVVCDSCMTTEVVITPEALRIKNLEAMIRGLMDAMRPLLDEWEKLK